MKAAASTVGILLCLLVVSPGAYAQSADEWYPAQNPGLMVANVGYDTRQNWGSDSRIGVQFTSNLVAYYYFSTSSATQLAEAGAIYAALLSAEISGTPVFIYINQSDPYSSGQWDFVSVQVGNNN
jgi:hypothetical protein